MPKDSLIIEEPPLQVLPTLAEWIGLSQAIVVQQLHYLCRNPDFGRVLTDDKRWIFNTYEEWQKKYFRFWTVETVRDVFQKLEMVGLVVSCQPEGVRSRRKYYRISDAARENLTLEKFKRLPRKPREKKPPKGKNYPIEEVNNTPSPDGVKITSSSCKDPAKNNIAKNTVPVGLPEIIYFDADKAIRDLSNRMEKRYDDHPDDDVDYDD